MCRDHGKAVDSDENQFTPALLRDWKRQAETDAMHRVLRNQAPPLPPLKPDQIREKLRRAAEADLAKFRNMSKWPKAALALTLKVDKFPKPVTTTALARAVLELDDLIVTAPPGMGKTTTVFQIADGILATESSVPVVVPLGDWATDNVPILESILKRTAFRDISDQEFRVAAAKSGMVLFLDGWNELDAGARERARVQIEELKAEVPELGLVVTTRRQVLDVPFSGTCVDILPLSEEQQMALAKSLRNDAGMAIVDQAWRTPGVRELVSIPLYLAALLSMPDGEPFPTTKEEVLRRFVTAHEREARRAEALRAIAKGFQQTYLEGLASFATRLANATVADGNARRAVAEAVKQLEANGQITVKPDPDAILDVLVNNHVLMRASGGSGVAFQHQQIQEWYASHTVERRIMAVAADVQGRTALMAEVFNFPEWEEPILFSIERMSRGGDAQKAACAAAILAAFDVDPMLAAEMIHRVTEDVWATVRAQTLGLVGSWHGPGKIDRALRFMMNSGRPEFLDQVWPLITNQDEQVSLGALRNCRRIRTSILGPDAVARINALADRPRSVLLSEIASHSGIDGLDLVTAIARDDPSADVQCAVIDMLAFRRADRHATEVLKGAGAATFDQVARRGLLNDVTDERVRQWLNEANERIAHDATNAQDRLRQIAFASGGDDRGGELTAILSEIEIQQGNDSIVQFVRQARKRYPKAIADGLLERLRAGRPLFFGADDILAAADFLIDDEWALDLALADAPDRDILAESAASILGPISAGRMIDALFVVRARTKDALGQDGQAANERRNQLEMRIAHIPGASLIAAVQGKSATADDEQLSCLAWLLSRRSDSAAERDRPFDAEGKAAIRVLIEDWAKRFLSSADAKRWHLAGIATLANRVPDVALLPLLQRLLNENLARFRAFRAKADASGWTDMEAANEARQPMTTEYQQAFLAIKAPETTKLMQSYLTDPDFGSLAAAVLAVQWKAANEPPPEARFLGGPDFGVVAERRAALAADPTTTSEAAEAIFAAIEDLLGKDLTEGRRKLVVALGLVATGLPHGRRDATIDRLVALMPWRTQASLFTNLILRGVVVETDVVATGIGETLEAAKTDAWIFANGEAYELREWLRLLPFTTRPEKAIEIVRALPQAQMRPAFLEEMIEGFSLTPSQASEEVLFKLAEDEPRLYQNYRWRDAVLKIGTGSAAFRLIELAANGRFDGERFDLWYWARALAPQIAASGEVRRQIYDMLRRATEPRTIEILAGIVAECVDAEGLLLLVEIELRDGKPTVGWRAIERVVTKHVQDENWVGAYNVVPDPVPDLRRALLAIVRDGGLADAAARCLDYIDMLRDDHGFPPSEPRHPDLASGKAWPMMRPILKGAG